MIKDLEHLPPDRKFDVLRKQAGIPEIHDFSGVSQPTDLPPVPEIIPESQKIQPKLEVKVLPKEDFILDSRITKYIQTLIISGNNRLKVLNYDLSYAESNEEVGKILEKSYNSGSITDEQHKILLGFLSEPIPVS